MPQTKQRDVYMVIGGNGFLGRHIVQQLLERGDIVSSFDIVERYNDVQFYSGDISDQESVASALRKVLIFFCPRFLEILTRCCLEWNDLYYSHSISSCATE
jgi:NAD(P)-dependent dehydrogenase (short-subunit alcohol dehydrogenase family)